MAGTNWVDFVANTKARAEDVNNNFDWIQGDFVPMNAGSTTNGAYNIGGIGKAWADVHMTGTLYLGGTDTRIKESAANIISVYANDTLSAQFQPGGIAIPLTQKLYLDGGGDSYIYSPVANEIQIVVGSLGGMYINDAQDVTFYGGIQIPAGDHISLDGAGDTYIHEVINNDIEFVTSNSVTARFNDTRVQMVNRDLYIGNTKKFYLDDGGDTYIQEVSANQIIMVAGGVNHFAINDSITTVFVNSADLSVESGRKVYLDGKSNTYLHESSADIAQIITGGTLAMQFAGTSIVIPAFSRLYFDGGDHTYIAEQIANRMKLFAGGVESLEVRAADSYVANGIRIGTDTTNYKIDDAVNGGASSALFIGNAIIQTLSDIRLKENIEDTKRDCLGIVNAVRVVDFDWNDKVEENDTRKQRGRYTGAIAQEMIKVAPWAIHHQGGKDCPKCTQGKECADHLEWQVEYEVLVPTLIKAIQELTARVKQLEKA